MNYVYILSYSNCKSLLVVQCKDIQKAMKVHNGVIRLNDDARPVLIYAEIYSQPDKGKARFEELNRLPKERKLAIVKQHNPELKEVCINPVNVVYKGELCLVK